MSIPGRRIGADWPAMNLRTVTPSDDDDLPDGPCRALHVGTGGNIAIIAADDEDAVTIPNVPNGLLPVRAKRVLDTGTTATGIVALY